MTDKPTKGFSKHFLWGASTAAHQVEGGNHNQWTVWELENAKTKAAQAEYYYHEYPGWERVKDQAKDPYNYISDGLADHYHHYKEDFDFLEKMNMNAYRFSIEWSRVEPEEGAWNSEEIAHYKDYISELYRRDIEPIMTLLHFTLPTWFVEKGGFEKRSNIKYFVRYVEKVVSELGGHVRFIIIMNEPEIDAMQGYLYQEWPPAQSSKFKFWRVINNQGRAFRKASKVIHGLNRRYKVGLSKHSCFYYPGDNAKLSHLSARIFQYFQDDYILKKYVKHSDFMGMNYYQSQRVFGYSQHNPENVPHSDLNWTMSPADIEFALERWHEKYGLPIMITENGLADGEDEHREWWIKQTIVAMQRAMKRGVNLIGYMHWSLMDNFEWAYGKWPRFGLVAVDYKTGKRTLRPSAAWFGRVIKKLRNQ
jgi:beta-glucosidase